MREVSVKFRTQIVGLTRFSYVGRGGFAHGDDDHETLMAQLFDPERLERRFSLFERLTMPSLLAQTDLDFTMIFLTSDSLPADARARLAAATAPLPGARIIALPPQSHYMAIKRGYAAATHPQATHLTGFRLDDDDALDIEYVARLRKVVQAILPVAGLDTPMVTGWNHGYFLERGLDGNQLYAVTERAPIGIGLAMTTRKELSENVYRRNHRLVGQFFHTYTDALTPAFIRTVHADNDSNPFASGVIDRCEWADAAPVIEASFPFSIGTLKTL